MLPALIFPSDLGLWYTNQVGGVACEHPVIRGVLVPLPSSEESYDFENCSPTEDEVRVGLARVGWEVGEVRKLKEAWTTLTIINPDGIELEVILTWENSD
jgi:hypothetical protein